VFSRNQFEALLKVLDSVNHYRVLKVGVTASTKEIQEAFHREALILHPDIYQGLEDPLLLEYSKIVYARVVEAYRILSNKTHRQNYDAMLRGDSPPNASPEERAEGEITSPSIKRAAASPAGMKFYRLAQSALQSGSYQSAKMNIQLALSSDPQSPEFQALLQRIEGHLKKPK
jgi:curved DNA-binding protein CbpA